MKHRGVEKLVSRRAHNPKVVGSSPTPATSENPPEYQNDITEDFLFFVEKIVIKPIYLYGKPILKKTVKELDTQNVESVQTLLKDMF